MKWLVSLAMIAALFVGGAGVAYASADALPGDMLYGVKSSIQNVQLALSGDEGDINLLLGFMNKHLHEVGELVDQGRFGDVDEGIGMYQHKLTQLLQTRERVSYEDAHAEEAITQRVQQELHTQTQLMQQLQERVKDQLHVQQKLQETIRQAENGAGHGPGEGGPPEESGGPSGAGQGEPQGELEQNQMQTGQLEDTSGPSEEPGNGGPGMEGECDPWEEGEGEAGEGGCGPGGGEDGGDGSEMPGNGHGGR